MVKKVTLTNVEIQALAQFFEDNLEDLEISGMELLKSKDEDDRIAGADMAKQAAVLRGLWKKL